jgi:hypothetical protein
MRCGVIIVGTLTAPVVTDKRGRSVTDLTHDDVRIFENKPCEDPARPSATASRLSVPPGTCFITIQRMQRSRP